MSVPLSRRTFLHTTVAAGAAAILAADEKKPSPNERLHVGFIGVNNQGRYDLDNVVAAGVEVAALCDVDDNLLGKAVDRFPKAKTYHDYRRLFDQKGLDAVVIATPDHSHAIPTLMALRAGLHVYCEKPLTHSVAEARLVAETAAKHKRVTQMGTQIHAGSNYRRVVEIIQAGVIGPVKEVHAWVDTRWGGGDRPAETPPIPAGLHYDLWLGPAPYRPYHPTYIPFFWRRWWDFGGGSLNDMACHYLDLPFWALNLRHPTHVKAEGPKPHPETAPIGLMVEYEFPARGELPPVKLTWYDGGRRPALVQDPSFPKWGNGVLFVGEKGMVLASYGEHKVLPEKEFAGFTPPRPTIPNSVGHHREWVQACKTGGMTTCNFDYSGALTECVLLGTVSYRLGKPFAWDAKNLKASESDAERYIHKEYRKGWSLG
jgi:predicted dehydrogenase